MNPTDTWGNVGGGYINYGVGLYVLYSLQGLLTTHNEKTIKLFY